MQGHVIASLRVSRRRSNGGGATNNGGAVAFSLGSKGYIGKGSTNVYYEYDPSTNTWTQVADFGCGDKYYAVGLAINGKGYVVTGDLCTGGAASKSMWQYDPGVCSGGTLRLANNNISMPPPQIKSLAAPTENNAVEIFPNPASGYITINMQFNDEEKSFFELYNVTGMRVFAYEITNGNNTITLPEGISNGVYISKIIVNGIIKRQSKLIIIR